MLRYLLLFLACFTGFIQPVRAASPELTSQEAQAVISLPRSTPEQQGIATAAIEAFVREAQATVHDMHSFMVVRHGRVVAEGWWAPYAAERPHMLYSLSKSFTSTAVGLAVSEGRFSLDDKVVSFFPDKAPAQMSDNLKAMRVRDLLAMAAGHAKDTTQAIMKAEDGDWARVFLSLPVEFKPGTHFVYNSGATYMLSAIVQRKTGQTVLEYLKPRLFEPLGIADPTWETCPKGINTGGWGLKLRTEEIARFGRLYLNKGVWNGRRILPEGWVEEATTAHSDNSANKDPDWKQGYCYQFWRCRYGAFRGDGACGQFCVALPKQEAVVVMTSGCGKLQGELELVWKHLLPAMKDAPLPPDEAANKRLKKTLAGLTLAPVKGEPASEMAARVTGKTFRFDGGQKLAYLFMGKDHALTGIRLDCGDQVSTLTLTDERGAHRIACGPGRWIEGAKAGKADPGDALQPVSGSGAWTAPDTFATRLCLNETPFCLNFKCQFKDGRMTVNYLQEPSAKTVQFVSTAVE